MAEQTMVERVARGIYATASGEERPDFDRQPMSVKRFYFQQARAAIQAMRVPTETMAFAGKVPGMEHSDGIFSCDAAEDVWRAMIDAALA